MHVFSLSLLETMFATIGTGASLLVTSALLVETMFAIRNSFN